MDPVQKLVAAIVVDHYVNDIYPLGVTLDTNLRKFVIKSMCYCDMLEPEKLLISYRPGFRNVIKKMLTDKVDGDAYESIDFIPL